MKLPTDARIAREKLTRYLLVKRAVGDKSDFLKQAGYTLDNPHRLEEDTPRQVLTQDAVNSRKDRLRRTFGNTSIISRTQQEAFESEDRMDGGEVGYSIEIFNAVGETMAVTTVPESLLEELTADEIVHVRSLAD